MNLKLKIWRQKDANDKGSMVDYEIQNVSEHMSFLEMLDVLNEELIEKGIEPIAFDHDCREGICGMCSLYINGEAHGPDRRVTTCQLHMRKFKDGDTSSLNHLEQMHFQLLKTWSLIDQLLTEYNMQEDIFQLIHLEIHKTLMLFPFQKIMQTWHLMRQLVLVVAHA